jgi:hypothetical protein
LGRAGKLLLAQTNKYKYKYSTCMGILVVLGFGGVWQLADQTCLRKQKKFMQNWMDGFLLC